MGKECNVRVGTWNAGMMPRKGEEELADVMKTRQICIMCLQEAEWKGKSANIQKWL